MSFTTPTRAFIFDMDGTIVDNMGYHTIAWGETLRAFGIDVEVNDLMKRTAGMTNREIFRILNHDEMTDEAIARFGHQKETRYREIYAPHITPMPGLFDLLREARAAGIKIGVATGAPLGNIEFTLKGLGIEPYIDAVVGAADIKNGKPDPEIFLKTAATLGAAPENVIVFEDALMGIEAARRAGMRIVVLTTTLAPADLADLPHVELAVPDFASLKVDDLLARNHQR